MKRRLESTETDVTLKVADKTFACRRKALADCSPYFDAMFNSNFIERDKSVIEIKGVDTDAMDILLHSTEASEVDILRSTNVLSVLQASCMLQFEAVKRSCIDLIMNEWLAVDSCLEIVHTARELDLCDLHDKAMAVALWEFSQVKKTRSFFDLSVLDLEAYLKDDGLNIGHGEFEVFDAGVSWIEEAFEERAKYLMTIVQCVRFGDVAGNDVQTMLLYPLVAGSTEVAQLLECIYEMKSSLHKGCPEVVHDDSNVSVELEQSFSKESKDLMKGPPADGAAGCYERLCQCSYFSGSSTESNKFSLDVCHTACTSSDCSNVEGSLSGDLADLATSTVALSSSQPPSKPPGWWWNASTFDLASRLLQQPSRWLPVLPCIVNHTAEEMQSRLLRSGKPFVYCYDEEKRDVIPVVQLAKTSDGPVELSGYVIAGRGPSMYITGGEFLLGHGSWNRTVWCYSLLSESWGYETRYVQLGPNLAQEELVTLFHRYNIPSVRRHHSACFLDDNLYLIGGFGKHRVIMSSVEKYNVNTKTWTRCAQLPQPLYNTACVAHKGQILVFSQQLFVYTPERDAWTSHNLRTIPNCLGFNSAMSHKDTIYLTGMYSTLLSSYLLGQGTSEEEQRITSVGSFTYNAANTCIVGDKIYNFASDSEDASLFVEVFTIGTGEFRVVWCSKDRAVEFSHSKSWSSCFPLVKY